MDKLLEDIDINVDKDICKMVRNSIQFNKLKKLGSKLKNSGPSVIIGDF